MRASAPAPNGAPVGGRPHLRLAASLVALAILAGIAAPAAGATPPPRNARGTRIIGGDTVTPRQYPFMAGVLITIGVDSFQCGGTVLSVSWVLTAGHCVTADDGSVLPPSAFQVRTGSDFYDSGGTVHNVATVVRRADFNGLFLDNDAALLRLAKPTSAPAVQVVGPSDSDLFTPGTMATTVGWGLTSAPPSGQPSDQLRHVSVPTVSDSTCASDYPIGRTDPNDGYPLEFHAGTMTCAGYPEGGKDSCNGDSGGPLLVPGPGTSGWRQMGIVSWGYQCALADNPGVYAKLTTYSTWVGGTRRFGPFADVDSYIIRNFVDFANRFPTPSEASTWRQNLASQPADALPISLEGSQTWKSYGWSMARLYRAMFLRDPDSGYAYWLDQRYKGDSLSRVAQKMAALKEFKDRYGGMDNTQFVTAIYNNVFSRDPDQTGQDYWVGRLNAGLSRSDLVVGFAQAKEYVDKTSDRVETITAYFAMLRRVPSAAELTRDQPLTLDVLVNHLRTSYSYANRF
ncbi:MAG: plasma kallikrein-like [Acidimicrobiales bacterium]|nr:plasma kallikrein-like [Acidimicrobiales bacterium]